MIVIPELDKLKQEHCDFWDSLDYTVRCRPSWATVSHLSQRKKTNQINQANKPRASDPKGYKRVIKF